MTLTIIEILKIASKKTYIKVNLLIKIKIRQTKISTIIGVFVKYTSRGNPALYMFT